MANANHLAILERGVEAWNQWRVQSPRVVPDLEGADLSSLAVSFSNINFSITDLRGAKLSGANLANANLYDARLNGAELVDTDLRGADLRGADFTGAIVDGIRYDKRMKCLGTRVDGCAGSPRFKRAVLETDYIEAFTFEHPLISKVWLLTSDYSRSPLRIGFIGLMLCGLFAVVYYIYPGVVHWPQPEPGQSQARDLWFSPLYYAVVTFTTLGYGDINPASAVGEMLASCEAVIGYVWLGYLVSVLANRASTRT